MSFTMGKKKDPPPPKTPSFQPSQIYVGNRLAGQTQMEGGQLITRYFEDPQEQQRRLMQEQRLAELIPTIGKPSQDIVNRGKELEGNYIQGSTEKFNNEFGKTQRALREDVGARFGTLSVSPFTDELRTLENDVRAPALNQIIREGAMIGQQLVNQEEARKLAEYQALGGFVSGQQAQQLAGMQIPLGVSQAGNQFNQNNYMGQLQAYNARLQNRRPSFWSQLFGGLNSLGGTAASIAMGG